ncbi:SbcC/MukB-like Walker B domain-containing protein, partial [Cohnella nanjingensis]
RKERESAERLAQAERARQEAERQGAALADDWAAAVRELKRFETELAGGAIAAGAAGEREAARTASARLAADLAEGCPCPVCGSLAHPAPAHAHPALDAADAESAVAEQWARMVRDWEQLRRESSDATGRAAWQLSRLRGLREASGSGSASPASSQPAALSEAAAGAEAASSPSANDWPDEWAAWAPLLRERREVWAERRAQLERLAEWQTQWETASSAVARERGVAAEAADAASEALNAAAAKRRRQEEAEAAARQGWARDYPDLRPEEVEAAAAAAAQAEETSRELRKRLDLSVAFIEEQETALRALEREKHELAVRMAEGRARAESVASNLDGAQAKLREWTGGEPAAALSAQAEARLAALRAAVRAAKEDHDAAQRALQAAEAARTAAQERELGAMTARERTAARLREALSACGFGAADEVRALSPRIGEAAALKERVAAYRQAEQQLAGQVELLRSQTSGEPVAEADWLASTARLDTLRQDAEGAAATVAKAERDAEDLASRRGRWEVLEANRTELAADQARMAQLQAVFRGNAFVEYIAEEQLEQVCRTASERLGFLTRRRYALEVDASGGFVIRDDANGGLRRPVSTLSGGETFLTSLALALALSAQIQLRGRYPLQFFFLDEGFGTLDQELLDTVVTSLEKLQQDELAVGVISHVPELQARLPRRLLVSPAEPGGRGSRITY